MAWVGAIIALAAAAASQYNTQQTAKKQDNALAIDLTNQGRKQKEADSKVNAEVAKLQGSTADASRRKSLDDYTQTLMRGRKNTDAGLTQSIGSGAFQADQAAAVQGVDAYGAHNADLMSRIDAPVMQRQGEAFDYGHLGTDLELVKRQAAGQEFLDKLRYSRIQRNPWIDAAAAGASAYGSSRMGSGGSGAGGGAASPYSNYGGNTYSASNYGPG